MPIHRRVGGQSFSWLLILERKNGIAQENGNRVGRSSLLVLTSKALPLRSRRKAAKDAKENRGISGTLVVLISLAQAVFAFDLIFRQASNAGEGASAVCDGYRDHDLVCPRSIVQADFHAIEMAADECGVFVA